MNHVGFAPAAAKRCLLAGTQATTFEVIDAGSGRRVYGGRTAAAPQDLGDYVVGDFSAVSTPGTFRVRSGPVRSEPFAIAEGVYSGAVRKCVSYFSRQRCGDSRTGYNTPCHLDDGRRVDNGLHQDATGG